MIEYLKKENFKLRSSAYLLKSDMNELKVSNLHLTEQYAALHDSHEANRQYSTEMSQANFKLNVKNNELKKKYGDAKKTLKDTIQENKIDRKKLKDLMNAKDRDYAEGISCLQRELAIAKESQRGEIRPPKTSKLQIKTNHNGNKKKSGSQRSSPNSVQTDKTTRAKVKGRKSPNPFSQIAPSPSIRDDERWGHDGFYQIVDEDTPSSRNSNNSTKTRKPRNRKSRKQRTPTNTSNGEKEKRIVTPDASPTIHRELSTSSLRSALDNSSHNISRTQGKSKNSSLAKAAVKPSSLAQRARKN